MRPRTLSPRPPARAITWPPQSWHWPASLPCCCCATSAQPMPRRPFTAPRSRPRAGSTSARRRRNERSLSRADGFMADVRRVVPIALFALLVAAPAAQAGTVGGARSTPTLRGGGGGHDPAVDPGGGGGGGADRGGGPEPR